MRLKKSTAKNGNTTYSIIKDYTNLSGKRSTCVFELLGNKESLIERFGSDNTMQEVQNYIKTLNDDLKKGKELPINISLNPNKRIVKDEKRTYYFGHIFLKKIFYDLGFDKICKNIQEKYKFSFNLIEILEYLLYCRIIWPSSKISTYEQSKNLIGNHSFELQHMYRSLDYIAKEMDNIQKDLFNYSNKVIDRNYKVIYYDCTNYFFYTEENDFQRYGISKQHQPLPLVQMGLFMDADGYPFAMNINSGNTGESTTMIPSEIKFLKDFELKGKNMIVCTDAAMCTDEIKAFNVKENRGFVITQSIKRLNKELKAFALDKSDWRILGNLQTIYNLEDIESNEELKNKYYNTIFYKEIECETKSVVQTLIVTFSFKYQEYQHKLKTRQLDRARKTVEEVNKKNQNAKKKKDIEKIKKTHNQNDPRRFIKEVRTTDDGVVACNINYIIDEEIYKEEEKYNGLYGITTNLIDDTETIIKVIKGRWEIEESFRILKHEFDSGTVYLSNENRIKAHFMTCYLSLFMYRFLEHQLEDKYTVSEIIETLQKIILLEHKGKGFEPIYDRNDLTDALHVFLGINTDNEIISYKKIKEIFNTISKVA